MRQYSEEQTKARAMITQCGGALTLMIQARTETDKLQVARYAQTYIAMLETEVATLKARLAILSSPVKSR